MPTRTLVDDDLLVTLDLAPQRLEVRRDPFDGDGPLHASLLDSYPANDYGDDWLPATSLALKAKAFDDGLVAAIELLLDDGWPGTPGRRAVLAHLVEACRAQWPASRAALAVVGTSWRVLGETIGGPKALRDSVDRGLAEAQADKTTWTPLGVYSWSEALTRSYRAGCLLQKPMPAQPAELLTGALRERPDLLDAYDRHTSVHASLCNAPAASSLLYQSFDGTWCVYPPACDPLNALLDARSRGRPSDAASVVELLADEVASGRLSLEPDADAGWYAHQLHALAPLLFPSNTPEAGRLRIDDAYTAHLRSLFAALYGLTRETHVKQLPIRAGAKKPRKRMVYVAAELTFEPLAEFYRRRAEAYAYLRAALLDLIPFATLRALHRLTPDGPVDQPLLDELLWIESLLRGAHGVVREELGFAEPVDRQSLGDRCVARGWAARHRDDPDLARDVRCMIPLETDPEQGLIRVQACVGFRARPMLVDFVKQPTASLRYEDGRAPGSEVELVWVPELVSAVRPATFECWIPADRLMDRTEFQRLCDGHDSPAGIARALQG